MILVEENIDAMVSVKEASFVDIVVASCVTEVQIVEDAQNTVRRVALILSVKKNVASW